MKKYFLAALLAAALWAPAAPAQLPARPGGVAPITRPTYSPYLNLLRRDNPAALNYYGLVRPELAFRSGIGTLQGDVAANRQLITTGLGGGSGELITGRGARFLNTRGYFLNASGGAAAGRGATGGGAQALSARIAGGGQQPPRAGGKR